MAYPIRGTVNSAGGGSGGGGASTVADGANLVEGTTTDAAVVGDNSGTFSAKFRGLSKILSDVWDSVNHFLKVSIQNTTLAVTQSGSWTVTSGVAVASAATLSNVASSATNVTLLASNSSRKGATIFNDSTQVLYVKFGATASATSFTYYVFPSQTMEFPAPIYQGIVDGLWASANGNARLTEIT